MQQGIAVAGLEERDLCGTRQPRALGAVTVLPGASDMPALPACVRSAVTVIRPVTALPGFSTNQDLPACIGSAVTVIQPVTSLPTSLQLPEHDEIAVAKAQPSALSPVLMRICDMAQPSALPPAQLCETAQPRICRDQSGDHVDAATIERLTNWAQRPEPSPCVTRGTVDAAALDPLSNWAQRPEPSPCVTRGTVDTAAPDLLSSWAEHPMPPAACGLLSVSRCSVAQVVGYTSQHSKNTPFSCSAVTSGHFSALDPQGRQVIDTATSAGAFGYMTALPPSSGLPLSSASAVDAIPSSLSLGDSAGPSLLGGEGMSQSGLASQVLSRAPDPLGTPPPGLTYQAGSQGSVGTPSYAHAPGVHQRYSLPQAASGPSFSSPSTSAHAGVLWPPL